MAWVGPAATATACTPPPSGTATGVGWSTVDPSPSSPSPPKPQAYRLPSEPAARLYPSPAATELAVTPGARVTISGAATSPAVAPSPRAPWRSLPQAYTLPSEPTARLWVAPADTSTAVTEGASATTWGVVLAVKVPSPSWPSPLAPQAYTLPSDPTARVKPAAAEIWTAPTPGARVTSPGASVPVPPTAYPSSPVASLPQLKAGPSTVAPAGTASAAEATSTVAAAPSVTRRAAVRAPCPMAFPLHLGAGPPPAGTPVVRLTEEAPDGAGGAPCRVGPGTCASIAPWRRNPTDRQSSSRWATAP